jgi:hypothetical protein
MAGNNNDNSSGNILTLIDSINTRLETLMNGNGKTVIDPTTNVKDLVEASNRRVNDLLASEKDRIDKILCSEKARINELFTIIQNHATDLRVLESKRIDALFSANGVSQIAADDRVKQSAEVLANQVQTSAENLKLQITQISEKLSELEKSQNIRSGVSAGSREIYGWIFAAVTILVAILGFFFYHH